MSDVSNPVRDAALEYAVRWKVFPADLGNGQKKSHKSAEHSDGRKWGMSDDPEEIRRDFNRWPEAVGIVTGAVNGIFVVETDTPKGHGVDGAAELAKLEAWHGPLPETLMAESPSGSVHRYFQHPGAGIKIKNSASELAPGVDVRGDGGMVIAPPSLRNGKRYCWINNLPVAVAPDWLIKLLTERPPHKANGNGSGVGRPEAALHRLIAATAVLPNDDVGWDEWNTHGMVIYASSGGTDAGLAIFDWWSRQSPKYDAERTRAKWEALRTCPPNEIGVGKLLHWAGEACPKWEMLAHERPDRTIADQMTEISEIARLAALPWMAYEPLRKDAAKRLQMRVEKLDEIVEKLRPRTNEDDDAQGTLISFDPPVPWTNPVDGAELITDVVSAIRKHVILSEHQALTVALWVMHAHAIDAAEHTPRLQIKSPTMRCGKTTVMNTIKPMLPKPVSTESITMAALFRVIAKWKPTLLIDEADSFLKREDGKDNEDLRGILNAGHGRSGSVIRTVGDEHEPRAFPVFGPVAYAWLVHRGRQVSETLADRSITIELRRRLPSEKITRLRSNRTDHLAILSRRAARWVSDHWADLTDADPSLPEGLSDRAQDNWRPLIAIADAISAEIGKIARDAAIAIAAERVDADVDAAIEALTDVAAVFEARRAEFLPSGDIVLALVGMDDHPWAEWRRGRPITARGLAQLLKPFGIRPELTRPRGGGRPDRGYTVQRIREAAERFVEQQPQEPEPEAKAPEGELPY